MIRRLIQALSSSYVWLYRRTGGAIGRSFRGGEVGLLTHRGARSGLLRTTPVMVMRDGPAWFVIASNSGGPRHPAWFHNLQAHPDDVTVEVGTERRHVRPRVATGAERDELWRRTTGRFPFFAGYQRATARRIPVVVLDHAV